MTTTTTMTMASWPVVASAAALILTLCLLSAWLYGIYVLRLGRILPWIQRLVPGAVGLAGASLAGGAWSGAPLGMALGALAAAGLFYGIQRIAPQPIKPLAVAVGRPILDFTAMDAAGQPFTLSHAMRGKAYLLKFYRGHW